MYAPWPLKHKYRAKKTVKSTPYVGRTGNSGTRRPPTVDWRKGTGMDRARGDGVAR